ncbi:helix-turn-helix domain-containing protein [Saccharopolyspora phatthalungensis]|uniref:Transcriptional regulator with XRE-family HTH domain n=1 Tax=Saccharopolyspora phatthalungensis TaxID=664693 RepID=A0A840QID8_9PSEU|nr:helix-turn-helix transcriptional regulator [Saccharopolyspora phatthalungensis]MBB5158479.1 transcriptional regulator with XRE-family HTH domain [Saccharopolyspora phatthalungensis]
MARTPKARALGGALRQAREDRGLKLREFSSMLGRDAGVLSRWETGERTPKPEQVAQILTALGVLGDRYEEIVSLAYGTDAPQWVATRLPDQKQQLSALVDYEQNASEITEVAPLLIPGLLQTSGYIRAIMSGGGVPAGEIATRAAIRIGRKDVITRDRPAHFLALVGEGALRQAVGGRDTMLDQLKYLLDMSKRPNIVCRIVPHSSGWNPSLEGGFLLIKQYKLDPVVVLENRRSGLFLHEYGDITAYQHAVDQVAESALDVRQSRILLHEAIKRVEVRSE